MLKFWKFLILNIIIALFVVIVCSESIICKISENHIQYVSDKMPPKPEVFSCPHGVNICKKLKVRDLPESRLERSNLHSVTLNEGSYNFILNVDSFEVCTSQESYWSLRPINYLEKANAIVTFSDCAGNDITLTFSLPGEQIAISQTEIDFGICYPGNVLYKKISIKNISADKIFTVNNISLKQLGGSYYCYGFTLLDTNLSKYNNNYLTIAPLDSIQFIIQFDAQNPGLFENTIEIDNSFQLIHLKAEVQGALIQVTNTIFDSIDIDSYNFSEITIANRGNGTLTIDSILMPQSKGLHYIFTSNELLVHDISKANPLILQPDESKTYQVRFMPEKERNYRDSITFLSNTISKYNGKDADSVAVLIGKGNEPNFGVSSYNWGRKRINTEQFPIKPYPIINPKTKKKHGIILFNKSSQVNKLLSMTYDTLLQDGIPTFSFDKSKLFGRLFGRFELDTISVTYFPRNLGGDTCVAQFKSMIGRDTSCTLIGYGVIPKIKAENCAIVCSENNNPSNPAKGNIVITNLNDTTWKYYDTLLITDLVEENIMTVMYAWEENHFRYDKAKIQFPLKLNPGKSLIIPIEYKSESTEPIDAYMTIKSDAIEEVKIKITGFRAGTDVRIKKDSEITLFPNPVNDILFLKNLTANCRQLSVFNEFGQEIKRFVLEKNEDNYKMSTNDLPNGIYILRIYYGLEILDKKFVVIR